MKQLILYKKETFFTNLAAVGFSRKPGLHVGVRGWLFGMFLLSSLKTIVTRAHKQCEDDLDPLEHKAEERKQSYLRILLTAEHYNNTAMEQSWFFCNRRSASLGPVIFFFLWKYRSK